MGVNIKGIIKGSALSLLITGVIIFILALLSYFTGIDEGIITICAYASVIIGILVGSILVSLSAPNKRLIHVMLVCIVYTAVLTGLSLIFNGSLTFNAHMAAVIGGIFGAALLGAMIGSR